MQKTITKYWTKIKIMRNRIIKTVAYSYLALILVGLFVLNYITSAQLSADLFSLSTVELRNNVWTAFNVLASIYALAFFIDVLYLDHKKKLTDILQHLPMFVAVMAILLSGYGWVQQSITSDKQTTSIVTQIEDLTKSIEKLNAQNENLTKSIEKLNAQNDALITQIKFKSMESLNGTLSNNKLNNLSSPIP